MNGRELYELIQQNFHTLSGNWVVDANDNLSITGYTQPTGLVFDQTLGKVTELVAEWDTTCLGAGGYIHSNLSPVFYIDTNFNPSAENHNGKFRILVHNCDYTGGNNNVGTLMSIPPDGSTSNIWANATEPNPAGSIIPDTRHTFKFEKRDGYIKFYEDDVLLSTRVDDYADIPLYFGWYFWFGSANSQYSANFIIHSYSMSGSDTTAVSPSGNNINIEYIGPTALTRISNIIKNYVDTVVNSVTTVISDFSTLLDNHSRSITDNATAIAQLQSSISNNASNINQLQSNVTQLQTDVNTKAADDAVVHTTGTESVAGTKTFTSTIVGSVTGNAGTCTVRFMNLVNSNEDLARVMNFTPPSLADVFNSWYRFSHANNYVQYNTENAEGNALADMQAWEYDSENNLISNSRNTDTYVGFISPDSYNKFVIKTEIGSASNSDDDSLSVIVAFMRDVNDVEHHISIVRDGGRNGETDNKFNIVYDYNYDGFGGAKAVLASGKDLINTTSGWAGHTALIYAERAGDTIIAKTTEIDSEDFTATLTYTLPSSAGDLSAEDYKNIKYMLSNKCPIGFGLHSQVGEFKLLEMSNIFDDLNIFDAANDVIYEYVNGAFVQTNRKVSDELADYTRVYNKNTGKEFIYYDGVAYES